jgi:CO dehydrogenase nickel-insertion accessory protein CooC1
MREMAAKAGIEIFFVLNKVDEQNKLAMIQNIGSEKIVAVIPQNNLIYMDNLAGKQLRTNLTEIAPICRLIEDMKIKSKGNRT